MRGREEKGGKGGQGASRFFRCSRWQLYSRQTDKICKICNANDKHLIINKASCKDNVDRKDIQHTIYENKILV